MTTVPAEGAGSIMDEIGDGMMAGFRFGQAAVFKVADFGIRGAKRGLKFTKSALKQLPIDKLRVSSRHLTGIQKMNLRKLFREKYGTSLRSGSARSGDLGAANDDPDALGPEDIDEEEALTDEQVLERVGDKKYFDKDYDAVRSELTQLHATWNDIGDRESEAEKQQMEDAIRDRAQKCSVVSNTLKRRILSNHKVFTDGIDQIQQVSEDLTYTYTYCTDTRRRLRHAKDTYAHGALLIPALQRRRVHLQALRRVTESMNTAVSRFQALNDLLHAGKYVDAVHMLHDVAAGSDCVRDVLGDLAVMRPILDDWSHLTSNHLEILGRINSSIADMMSTRSFVTAKYLNAMEAIAMLQAREEAQCIASGRPVTQDMVKDCFLNVIQSLWNAAIEVMMKAISDLSTVKEERGDVARVVAGVDTAHLLPAVIQLCGRMAEFLSLFQRIWSLHDAERRKAAQQLQANTGSGDSSGSSSGSGSGCSNSAAAAASMRFHELGAGVIASFGHGIGCDLGEKLKLVAQHARLQYSAPSPLPTSSGTIQRDAPKHLDMDKVLHLFFVLGMVMESLTFLNLSADEMRDCRQGLKGPLIQFMAVNWVFRRSSDLVGFVSEDSWDTHATVAVSALRLVRPLSAERYKSFIRMTKAFVTGGSTENPFYTPMFTEAQDMSALLEVETLGVWFEREGASQGLTPGMSKMLVDSCGQFVANMMMETIARVVLRYPPLAAEALQWCEDWVGLYVFLVSDNFVSCSREVALEKQPHFSNESRRMLANLREGAKRVAPEWVSIDPATSETILAFPRLPDAVFDDLTSPGSLYGLVRRCVAVESCNSVLLPLRAAIGSLSPLVMSGVVQARRAAVGSLAKLADELLQVIMHRMVLANFPTAQFRKDISDLFRGKQAIDVGRPSLSMVNLLKVLDQFVQQKPSFPSRRLEELFLRRLLFAVQSIMVQEYSLLVMNPDREVAVMNVNRKDAEGMFLLQLKTDATTFNERAPEMLPSSKLVPPTPNYVKDFVNAAFESEMSRRKQWIEKNHTWYQAADLANWFCHSSRTSKRELDQFLDKTLQHVDVVPIFAVAELD